MSKNDDITVRLDATYIAPIVPKFGDAKAAFLAEAYKPYLQALLASADTHHLVSVPIPDTFRIENGEPTADFVMIDVRGTGSPMLNVNPEFVLLTLGSNAGLLLVDKTAGLTYKVLGNAGRTAAKNILMGEAVNAASQAATGKTFGLNLRTVLSPIVPDAIKNNTPEIVKEYVSEAFNPYYYGFRSLSPFLRKLIYDTVRSNKAGVIPTTALLYQLNFGKPTFNTLFLPNVGWGPKLTIAVSHLAETPITQFRLFNPEQWGVRKEGQNPLGIWFSPQLKVGVPRMTPRKRLKAARARAAFQTRPWEIEGELTLNKPIVTIGEVLDRSALEYAAERAGADGIIFNNIYDNGLNLTTSIKSFVEPTITNIKGRPRIMYFGPTMGKTTFTKANPGLIFDDADRIASKEILWAKRVELAKSLGIDPRDFGTDRVPEEIANSPLYKAAMEEYLATFLDSMSDYVSNPKNAGRILLTSNKNVLDPNNRVYLSNTPVVPDFNTFLERNQRRGFRETPELALEWWNSIVSQPDVQIDNGYVTDHINMSNFLNDVTVLSSNNLPYTIEVTPLELGEAIAAMQGKNGYYFFGHGTGRTNPDPNVFFTNGLRIKNADAYNTTVPFGNKPELIANALANWEHLNSEEVLILPANASKLALSATGRYMLDWFPEGTFEYVDIPPRGLRMGFTGWRPISDDPNIYTTTLAPLAVFNKRTNTLLVNPNNLYFTINRDAQGKLRILPRDAVTELAENGVGSNNPNPIYAKTAALRGLQQLKLFYASPAYRERVVNAYPSWSEEKVDLFIQNRINKTNLAINKLVVNRNASTIGDAGQTTIITSLDQHEPIGIEVALDAVDPLLTSVHEGLHFTSTGGRNPARARFSSVYEDPDAVAIEEQNKKILPRLTKSWYKKYTETSDLKALKKEYHDYVKFYYPYLTDAQIEEAFNTAVIKEGTYYNLNNELRSIGLSELIKAISNGEIKNPNSYVEVLRWLTRIDSNGTISPKLKKVIHEYRPDMMEWAKYLAEALSIGSIPVMSKSIETYNNK